MSLILITPKKNHKNHFVGAKQVIEEVDPGTGENKQILTQKFEESRFPGTTFILRVPWDMQHKRFKLKDMSEAEINSYVDKIKLTYESGPKKGTLIREADIYNQEDPFFNHRKLQVKSEGGVIKLNKEIPLDYLMYKAALSNKKFHEKGSGPTPGNVRFIITDSKKDSELETVFLTSRLEATSRMFNMGHAKRLAVAISLGLAKNDTDPDSLIKLLDIFINNPSMQSNGMYNKDIFLAATNEKTEDLELKVIIEKAKSASILREQKNKGFLYNGNLVAKNLEEMVEFLKNLNNKDIFDKIVEAIEEKNK